MKRIATACMLLGVLAFAANAEDLVMIGPSIGQSWNGQYLTGCVGDIKHSQLPHWDNGGASQDEPIQGQDPGCSGGLVAEVADDFPGGGAPITAVRYWSISFGLQDPPCPPAGITIMPDAGGCPDETAILCDEKPDEKSCEIVTGYPGAFSYEHCSVLAEPCDQPDGTLWISIVAHFCRADGGYQGNQWYWAMQDQTLWGAFGAELCFRSAYFGYPNWVPGSLVFGAFYDASFELIAGEATPTEDTSWGTLKDLYR